MLLPLIQDIEIIDAKDLKKKEEKNIYDYIFVEKDGEIFKFKAELEHISIVNAISYFSNSKDMDAYQIMSENQMKNTDVPFVLFPYLGKFRLEDKILKTDNYLVPQKNSLDKFLYEKYKNTLMTPSNLLYLYDYAKNLEIDEYDIPKLETIKIMLENINVELIEKYSFDSKQDLNEQVEQLLGRFGSEVVLNKLKWILRTSKENKKYIRAFGLEEKFKGTIEKQYQKVK